MPLLASECCDGNSPPIDRLKRVFGTALTQIVFNNHETNTPRLKACHESRDALDSDIYRKDSEILAAMSINLFDNMVSQTEG